MNKPPGKRPARTPPTLTRLAGKPPGKRGGQRSIVEQGDGPNQDFAAMLADFERGKAASPTSPAGKEPGRAPAPKVGDVMTVQIVSFGEESAFVDLGGKAEGVIPLAQLTDADGNVTASVGDSVGVLVAAFEDDVAVLRVRSRPHATASSAPGSAGGDDAVSWPADTGRERGKSRPADADWSDGAAEAGRSGGGERSSSRGGGRGHGGADELAQAYTHHIPVDGIVQAVIKGGVEVTVHGVRAFCPISQLDARYVEDATVFVGQRLSFRISRFEEGRGRGPNVVLSRRALIEEQLAVKAEEARANLEVGKVVRGKVTSLASYGAFVDLGGIEGLLHVSELGFGRIAHPQEVLTVGQEIEVEIQKIEAPRAATPGGPDAARRRPQERISLTRRSLMTDPWQDDAARIEVGSRHTGRVARLESFGAFVELRPGVDGLLHLSEMASGKRAVSHPREVVRVGQTVEVRVLSIDAERRRLSLGLTSADADAEADAAGHQPAPTAGFGAFGDFFAKAKSGGGQKR